MPTLLRFVISDSDVRRRQIFAAGRRGLLPARRIGIVTLRGAVTAAEKDDEQRSGQSGPGACQRKARQKIGGATAGRQSGAQIVPILL